MAQEKIFADGFSFKRQENAPDFVIGRLSLKVDEAIAFIKENEKKGWVNLNVKTAKSGSFYVELDTYEPKPRGEEQATAKPKAKAPTPTVMPQAEEDDLPF
jgi:hypothetical protein